MESEKTTLKGRKSFFEYIQVMKEEVKKVSWTTQEELRFSTKMVVLATLVFGMGIYVVDFLIKSSLEFIKAVVHFIFG